MKNSNSPIHRTFILIKPDAVERKLTGEILRRFERKGLRIVASSLRWISKDFAEDHYQEHKGNTQYFKAMCEAISCGPSMAVILEGPHAIDGSRQLIGSQQPINGSAVGTIRGDFGLEAPFNLVHGSDSTNAAHREITLWFGKEFVTPSPIKQEVPKSILSPPKKVGKKIPDIGIKMPNYPVPAPDEFQEVNFDWSTDVDQNWLPAQTSNLLSQLITTKPMFIESDQSDPISKDSMLDLEDHYVDNEEVPF